MRCVICGKDIERDVIPRLEPVLNKLIVKENDQLVDKQICDACGNLLTIVSNMTKWR